jgi:hypothetical protein
MAQAVELSKLQVGSPEFKPQYTKKKLVPPSVGLMKLMLLKSKGMKSLAAQ